MALFGLMPPMANRQLPVTTWGQLKATLSERTKQLPLWLIRLEEDIVAIANERSPTSTETSFSSGGKIWRPVLARHLIYDGGDHRSKFYLLKLCPANFSVHAIRQLCSLQL